MDFAGYQMWPPYFYNKRFQKIKNNSRTKLQVKPCIRILTFLNFIKPNYFSWTTGMRTVAEQFCLFQHLKDMAFLWIIYIYSATDTKAEFCMFCHCHILSISRSTFPILSTITMIMWAKKLICATLKLWYYLGLTYKILVYMQTFGI